MTNKNFSDFGRFDFMRIAPIMGAISIATFVLALFFIFTKGFVYGIDFAGGTELQIKFDAPPDTAKIRDILAKLGDEGASVQSFGTGNEVLIRMQQARGKDLQETNRLNKERVTELTNVFKTEMNLTDEGILRVDTVGPQVGSELRTQAMLSVLYSLIAILLYIGLSFDLRYAPGAVLCLFHDTIVLLGIFALIGREVNVQVLAGVLTLIGYSINDTIVVYDSMRGNEPLYKEKGLTFIINKSINEMLIRTMLTGGTTFVCAVCLYVFGSGVIQDIAFTMILGIILGTFSSIYVAAPLVPITDRFIKKLS